MNDKEYIECECGTHVLQVTHEIEEVSNGKRSTFNLAMFQYGKDRRSWFERVWDAMWDDPMHDDQIIMTVDEAKRLAAFIDNHSVVVGPPDQSDAEPE